MGVAWCDQADGRIYCHFVSPEHVHGGWSPDLPLYDGVQLSLFYMLHGVSIYPLSCMPSLATLVLLCQCTSTGHLAVAGELCVTELLFIKPRKSQRALNSSPVHPQAMTNVCTYAKKNSRLLFPAPNAGNNLYFFICNNSLLFARQCLNHMDRLLHTLST